MSTRDEAQSAVRRQLGYIGEREVEALLGVTPLTLRNRISQGKAPPSFKVGKDHLFDPKEVQAWIKRRRVDKAA